MTAPAWEVRQGDCIEGLAALAPGSVDAIVTDPPYGIGFMGKAWDTFSPSVVSDRQTSRARKTPHDPSSAKYPTKRGRTAKGAGSGGVEYDESPKAHREFQAWCSVWGAAALAAAKPGAHLLAFGGTRTYHRLAAGLEDAGWEVRDQLAWLFGQGMPTGAAFEGGRYGTRLKPALEPILLARKPCGGPVARCRELHGTGALNVEACAIPITAEDRAAWDRAGGFIGAGYEQPEPGRAYQRSVNPIPHVGIPADRSSRWPANVVLDEEAAAVLDAQSGERKGGGNILAGEHAPSWSGLRPSAREFSGYGDTGGASRFLYVAKPCRAEREAGLSGDPVRVKTRNGNDAGGDPVSDRFVKRARNVHPTVKPIALMRWLVRLVTPAGGLVVDPFTGSGTTGIAAALEGRGFLGFEREAVYARLARARIRHFAQLGAVESDHREIAKADPTQGLLFDGDNR